MKIFYISYTRPEYPLNFVRIRGLRENGVEVVDAHIKDRGIRGLLQAAIFYRRNAKSTDAVMIGYDSPALVILLWLVCRKQLIYNAVLPVYERVITSRKLAGQYSVKGAYYWVLDFLAGHLASVILLESNHQIAYFCRLFLTSPKKCFRAWIGVDDQKFIYNPTQAKFERFTAIFRGQFLPEAGVEYVVQAAKILEGSEVDIILVGGGHGFEGVLKLIDQLKPKNLVSRFEYVSDAEMVELMQKSHVSLGQLADHPRLERTLPHKCFESLALGLAYLTGRNAGVLELLKDGETCITCNPADADDLAKKILWAKNNYTQVEKIAENGHQLYQGTLTPRLLAKNILGEMQVIRQSS